MQHDDVNGRLQNVIIFIYISSKELFVLFQQVVRAKERIDEEIKLQENLNTKSDVT